MIEILLRSHCHLFRQSDVTAAVSSYIFLTSSTSFRPLLEMPGSFPSFASPNDSVHLNEPSSIGFPVYSAFVEFFNATVPVWSLLCLRHPTSLACSNSKTLYVLFFRRPSSLSRCGQKIVAVLVTWELAVELSFTLFLVSWTL